MASETLTGSCLCGAVTYTATGDLTRAYHCHCARCRKATGTGHATNAFLEGTLVFHTGEELIGRYKVPEAQRFTNTFCTTCGGRVPRLNASSGTVVIPLGSLDVTPSMKPQARIFVGSKAEWSCGAEVLPEHTALPE